MPRRVFSVIFLLYILIGIYVAWIYGYITAPLLKRIAEALLAVFLWFVLPLGGSLHIS